MEYISQNKLSSYRKENQPKVCPILNEETDDWVVDHDHFTGFIRGVISRKANTFIGKIENSYTRMGARDRDQLPVDLESVARYLRKKNNSHLHPTGANQLSKRFLRMKKDQQISKLMEMGAKKDEINSCTNASERTKIYSNLIKGYKTKCKN